MTYEEAAALPQAGAIALQGIHDKGLVQPGQKVLINGAGGGSGMYAIQLAKLNGAKVTGVDNSEKLEFIAHWVRTTSSTTRGTTSPGTGAPTT